MPANLVQLGQAVRDNGCAIGFAIDPGRRPRRVSRFERRARRRRLHARTGGASGGGAAARPGRHPRFPPLRPLQTRPLPHNCPVFLTAVGEVHVVEKMMDEEAVIGGEGNGGVIVTQIGP